MPDKIHVVSFGYLYASRPDADVTFDLRGRFEDPYERPELRSLTGLHPSVMAPLFDDPDVTRFVRDVLTLAAPFVTRATGGPLPLILAFGDAAGHHLSVVVARMLVSAVRQRGWGCHATHRDLTQPLPPRAPIRDDQVIS